MITNQMEVKEYYIIVEVNKYGGEFDHMNRASAPENLANIIQETDTEYPTPDLEFVVALVIER